MLATRIEQWEQAIRQASLEEGIEKGISKGEISLFIKMLERKWGPLPSWAQDRIAQADAATIERWAANLFEAQTLEAVFDPYP